MAILPTIRSMFNAIRPPSANVSSAFWSAAPVGSFFLGHGLNSLGNILQQNRGIKTQKKKTRHALAGSNLRGAQLDEQKKFNTTDITMNLAGKGKDPSSDSFKYGLKSRIKPVNDAIEENQLYAHQVSDMGRLNVKNMKSERDWGWLFS